MYVVLMYLIHETRPDTPRRVTPEGTKKHMGMDLTMFLNKPFFTVAFATIAIGTMQQGVFQSIFPIYAQDVVNMPVLILG